MIRYRFYLPPAQMNKTIMQKLNDAKNDWQKQSMSHD